MTRTIVVQLFEGVVISSVPSLFEQAGNNTSVADPDDF